jgi:hypothetical protein
VPFTVTSERSLIEPNHRIYIMRNQFMLVGPIRFSSDLSSANKSVERWPRMRQIDEQRIRGILYCQQQVRSYL